VHGIGHSRTAKSCCDGEEKENNGTTTDMLHAAGALYKDHFTRILSKSSATLRLQQDL
jgi:hypothetical protein